MRLRYLLAFSLGALGLILFPNNCNYALGYVLVSLCLVLLFPEAYYFALVLSLGGYPLNILAEGGNFCVEAGGRVLHIYFGFEIVDSRHGVADLGEKSFWFYSQSFLSTSLAGSSSFYIVIDNGRYFLLSRVSSSSVEEIIRRITDDVRRLTRSFERHGLSYRLLSGREVLSLLRPSFLQEAKEESWRKIFLAMLGLLLMWRIPLLFSASAALIVACLTPGLRGYRPVKGKNLYSLTLVQSFYSYPSIFDVFARARLVFSIADQLFLVLRVTPSPLEIEQEIDSKAYRSYEVGTALDKLSIIHASAKFFAASRRRWERRENLFLVSGLLLASENEARILQSAGFVFRKTIFPLGALA